MNRVVLFCETSRPECQILPLKKLLERVSCSKRPTQRRGCLCKAREEKAKGVMMSSLMLVIHPYTYLCAPKETESIEGKKSLNSREY